MAELPQIVVEVGFNPAPTGTDLVLDDPARGLLDTGTLASGIPWTDISAYVRSFSVSIGKNRATETFKAGTASLVLDNSSGNFDPENLSGTYVTNGETNLVPMVPIRISGTWGGTTYWRWQGFIDEWVCQYPGFYDAVTTVRATDAFKVLAKFVPSGPSAAVGTGELSGARVHRILDAWNWPGGDRDIDTGLNTLQATTLAQNALQELETVAVSEMGDLYISTLGRVAFRQRYSRSSRDRCVQVQATFSDVQASVEAGTAIGYQDITRVGDGDLIRNTVTRQNIGGSAQTVTDVDSVARYQTVTDVRTDLVNDSDLQALSVAQWTLSLYSTWEQRIDSITVMPAANPTVAWPIMLGLDLLDRVRVVRTPPNVSALTTDCFVQGIDWSGDPENWVCRLFLEPAASQTGVLILDSVSLGLLDTGVLAA